MFEEQPLLKSGSAQAARDFVDALRTTLASATSDAAALNAVVQRGPSTGTAHAVEASRHMLEASAALRVSADPVLAYLSGVPDIMETVQAADDVLDASDALLDVLEERLLKVHGVSPVTLPDSINRYMQDAIKVFTRMCKNSFPLWHVYTPFRCTKSRDA
jgi:hypothetical protein